MNAVRAEFAKLATLPAIVLTALLTPAVTRLLGTLTGEPIRYTGAGLVVLGVLAAGQEFEDGGQIRATLLAMPRRGRLMTVKAVALLGWAVPVAALSSGRPGATARLVLVALVAAAVTALLRRGLPALLLVLTFHQIVVPRGPDAALAAELAVLAVAAVLFPRRDA